MLNCHFKLGGTPCPADDGLLQVNSYGCAAGGCSPLMKATQLVALPASDCETTSGQLTHDQIRVSVDILDIIVPLFSVLRDPSVNPHPKYSFPLAETRESRISFHSDRSIIGHHSCWCVCASMNQRGSRLGRRETALGGRQGLQQNLERDCRYHSWPVPHPYLRCRAKE